MTPEATFAKAWGREPSRAERERIKRLQAAFAIDENDALLTIAMVLEFYDGHFRLYPEKCAEAVRRVLANDVGEHVRAGATPPSPAPHAPLQPGSGGENQRPDWVTLGGLLTTFMMLFAAGIAVGVSVVASPSPLASTAAWIVAPVPLVYVGTWAWSKIRNATSTPKERILAWATLTVAGVTLLAGLMLLRAGASGS